MALRTILPRLPYLIVLRVVQDSSEGLKVLDWGMEELGRSQPRLEELSLEQSPWKSEWTGKEIVVTLSGLLRFASYQYSRCLETLTVSVVSPYEADSDGPIPTLPSLRTLVFQHLELEEGTELAFATFLAKLCPNLRVLSVRCFYVNSKGDRRSASSALLEDAFWVRRRRFPLTSWTIATSTARTPSSSRSKQ